MPGERAGESVERDHSDRIPGTRSSHGREGGVDDVFCAAGAGEASCAETRSEE